MCFIVLRKKAWNYGRMAVMQKEELKVHLHANKRLLSEKPLRILF